MSTPIDIPNLPVQPRCEYWGPSDWQVAQDAARTWFDSIERPQRRHGIAYLTLGGLTSHHACFSRYGRTSADCAEVAWRVAYLFSRETGGPITSDALDHAMGMVVNEHDDVAYVIHGYGHGHYR